MAKSVRFTNPPLLTGSRPVVGGTVVPPRGPGDEASNDPVQRNRVTTAVIRSFDQTPDPRRSATGVVTSPTMCASQSHLRGVGPRDRLPDPHRAEMHRHSPGIHPAVRRSASRCWSMRSTTGIATAPRPPRWPFYVGNTVAPHLGQLPGSMFVERVTDDKPLPMCRSMSGTRTTMASRFAEAELRDRGACRERASSRMPTVASSSAPCRAAIRSRPTVRSV